jgi:hypothetical protein
MYVTGLERGLRPSGAWSTISSCSMYSIPSAPPTKASAQHIVDERRLARARHPGHHGEDPEGDADVDPLEVVKASSLDVQEEPVSPPPARRDRNPKVPAEVLRGEAAGLLSDGRRRSLEDHAPPLVSGTRPQVDHVVRGSNDVRIVLDHDDRVPLPAQRPQDVHEAIGVAGMKADGRLVQHEQGPHQSRAEGRGQRDPL